MKAFAIVVLLLFTSGLFAKRFTNQYCEFELPPGWECALEGHEWVCQSVNKDRKKEAIIILAAKIRGQQDALADYQAYLKSPKSFRLPGGKTQVSEAKYTNLRSINGQRWVDSLHLASEVPGFYTRYLATVKADLGVAVTFSVSKDHYNSYQNLFDKVVGTLRVFRQKDAEVADFKLKKKEENLLDDSVFIPQGDEQFQLGQKKQQGGGESSGASDFIVYGLIAAAVVGFIIKKKRGG